MKYNVGDKLLLAGIECQVALVNVYGQAYLTPAHDGDDYNNQKTYIGLVFAVINERGKDKLGNKAQSIANYDCGAV